MAEDQFIEISNKYNIRERLNNDKADELLQALNVTNEQCGIGPFESSEDALISFALSHLFVSLIASRPEAPNIQGFEDLLAHGPADDIDKIAKIDQMKHICDTLLEKHDIGQQEASLYWEECKRAYKDILDRELGVTTSLS